MAECCGGTRLSLCGDCGGNDAARARLGAEREALRAWLDRGMEIDVAIGARFAWVGTDVFDLAFSISEWKIKRKKTLRLRAGHVFAARGQKAADRWLEITGLKVERRPRLIMMENAQEMTGACAKYAKGMKAEFSLLLPGKEQATWLTYPFHEGLYADDGMHSHVVHNMAHILYTSCGPFQFRGPAWLDVGLAHLLEAELMKKKGKYHTWCAAGGASHKDPWSEPKGWMKQLKKTRRDTPVTLAKLASTTLYDMKQRREHVHCWLWTRWLRKKHPKKIGPLILALKESGDTEASLRKVLGLDLAGFHKRAGRL